MLLWQVLSYALHFNLFLQIFYLLSIFFAFLYALRAQLFSARSLTVLEVKEETEEWRESNGEGWVSVELVGRSGAAPPVIIRVTAALARLCAACTRRDVLPREKSEHLSVPPRRQQPPTSLSYSTQLVTRSPNSYFLSLMHAHTRCYSGFLYALSLLLVALSSGQVVKAVPALQTAQRECIGLKMKWNYYMKCKLNVHSVTERLWFKLLFLSLANVNYDP